MDMIERVAKAIMRADTEGNPRFDYEEWTGKEWIGKEWRHYASQAREAIAAMREPTDEMVRQCMVYTQCMDTGHTRDDAEGAWQAMIDAALNETKSTTKGEVA